MPCNRSMLWLGIPAVMMSAMACLYTVKQLSLPNNLESALFYVRAYWLFTPLVLLPAVAMAASAAWEKCANKRQRIWIVAISLAILLSAMTIPEIICWCLRHGT